MTVTDYNITLTAELEMEETVTIVIRADGFPSEAEARQYALRQVANWEQAKWLAEADKVDYTGRPASVTVTEATPRNSYEATAEWPKEGK